MRDGEVCACGLRVMTRVTRACSGSELGGAVEWVTLFDGGVH